MTIMTALKPLVGRWSTTIEMISPSKMAGEIYRAIDTYLWMLGEHVLIHEVEARMGDQAIQSLEIYSETGGRIVSRNFDAGGHVSDYTATMSDGVWSISGATERFTSMAITADGIEGLWQMKDGDGWTDWMTVRLERVS